MRKITLLSILCILFSINIVGQTKTIGIGRLGISLNKTIPLYSTFADKNIAFDSLIFGVIDTGNYKGKFTMNTKQTEVKPLSYYSGDSDREADGNIDSGLTYFHPRLTFRVLEERDNSYRVVINEDTFETAIIRKDKDHKLYMEGKPYWGSNTNEIWFLYETWEIYIKRLMDVSIDNNEIYDFPEGKVISVDQKIYNLKGTEIQGYWLKLVMHDYSSGSDKYHGWVKWTDGKDILVDFTEEYYY